MSRNSDIHSYHCDNETYKQAMERARSEGVALSGLVRRWVSEYASGSSVAFMLTAADIAALKAARHAGELPVRKMTAGA